MGFENKYPYTDFHEMNLDWILELVKRLETEWPEFKTTLETEWNEYKDELTGENGEWPTFKTQIETIVRNFIHDVVGNYNGNLDYKPGMFCYYEGNVYKCTTGSSAAYPRPFSAYGWFIYAGQNTNSIVNDLFNYLTDTLNGYDTEIFYWIQHTAAEWDDTTAYKAGDYCSAYVGGFMTPSSWRYYKCIQDCTGINVFNTNYWKEVVFASDVAETIAAYKQAMQDQYDQFLEDYRRTFGVVQVRGSSTTDVMSQKAVSDELQAHDDLIDNLINDIADPYDSTKAYKIGILLTYLGKQYYCIADAPAGTLPTNTTYFEEKSVADIIEMIKAGTIVVGHSAVADNLTPYSEDSGTTQENPFISQGTGTDNNSVIVTTGNIARQLEKQGNTIVKNQYATYDLGALQSLNTNGTWDNNVYTYRGVTLTISSDKITINGTVSGGNLAFRVTSEFPSSIPFLIGGCPKGGSTSTFCFKHSYSFYNADTGNNAYNANYGGGWFLFYAYEGQTFNNVVFKPFVVKIAQFFNGTVPTDLTANPSHFSWYYNGSLAYDAGSLQNCNGRYLECGQGRCLFDKEMTAGYYWTMDSSGSLTKTAHSDRCCSTNFVHVVPNKPVFVWVSASQNVDINIRFADSNGKQIGDETGWMAAYFNNAPVTDIIVTPPSGAYRMYFTYSKNVVNSSLNTTVSLYYTPEEGGEGYNQHYDYIAPIRIDTGNETLKAFDKKLPSGVITRGTLETDLGSLVWVASGSTGVFYCSNSLFGTKGGICSKYSVSTVGTEWTISAIGDKTIQIAGNNYLVVADSAFAGQTAEQFKTAMSGVMLQTHTNTSTEEQGTPFSEYADINDYSYMAWFDTDGNLVSIPQGCKLFYPVDYKGFLDDGVMYTDGDFTSLAKNEDITDAALNARGYYKLQDLSSGITDSVGLTYSIKKLIKMGDMLFLNIRATNATGNEIVADTPLFSVPSGAYSSTLAISFACSKSGDLVRVVIATNGETYSKLALANNDTIQIYICYTLA